MDKDVKEIGGVKMKKIETAREALRQFFAYLPGDVISKSRFVIEEQDWNDKRLDR